MKKTALIIIASLFFTNLILGQEPSPDFAGKLQFGLKIGANLSNVYDATGEAFTADSKIGIVSGVFAVIPVADLFGLQPEILISQKGFNAQGVFLGSAYKFKRTSNYIDVPLLVSFKPIPLVTILAGPQYSFLFSQKDEFESGLLTIQQEQDFKNENIRRNMLCFVGGADINAGHFVLGLRAGWDLFSNAKDDNAGTPRYKNVWYQASLGFRFF